MCSEPVSEKYFLSRLEHCASVGMASVESHLGCLDSVVCSTGKVCEGECLSRADYSMHEYLHHFVAAGNTRASGAPGELALVIPGYRTDKFSSVVSACCRTSVDLLSPGLFSGGP